MALRWPRVMTPFGLPSVAAGSSNDGICELASRRLRSLLSTCLDHVGEARAVGILRNWDNCRTAFGRSLIAPDGTQAGYTGYFWERRVRGGRADCKGKTYDGPAISDVRNEGSGIIWLERWGTLAIRFARMVVVADAVQGAPICGEGTGTWIATAGPIKGERGEFTFRGPPPETITLR